jgi:hypothetical protein
MCEVSTIAKSEQSPIKLLERLSHLGYSIGAEYYNFRLDCELKRVANFYQEIGLIKSENFNNC